MRFPWFGPSVKIDTVADELDRHLDRTMGPIWKRQIPWLRRFFQEGKLDYKTSKVLYLIDAALNPDFTTLPIWNASLRTHGELNLREGIQTLLEVKLKEAVLAHMKNPEGDLETAKELIRKSGQYRWGIQECRLHNLPRSADELEREMADLPHPPRSRFTTRLP